MALTLLATNNAESVLASAISATDTSLIVSAGTGAEFPDAVAGESYFKLTITDAATGSQVEIVNVTAKAGDIFTIERAQEGTLARAWAANDMVANMMTADTLNVIADFANQAADSAEEAQGYALSAAEFGDNKLTFADTTAGLAGTTSGQYFRVPQGVGNVLAFRYYKNNAGVAVEVAEYPGQGSISNSIREYATLSAAQADADAGNILNGSYCWVRNSADATLADEYINNAGTLQPTGRKMPSQQAVDNANYAVGQVATASSVRDNQLHGMSMPDRRTLAADFTQQLSAWSVGGSVPLNNSGSFSERTLLRLTSFSTAFSTAACILTITGAGRTLFSQGFFNGETLADGVLTTPYFDVSMRQFVVDSVSASTVNTWVLKGKIKLPQAYSTTEGRVLRDRQNRITIGLASSSYTYTVDTLAFDAANALLYVAVSRSAMIAAGYSDTTDGAQQYFWDVYGGIILSQKSTTSQTLPEYTLFFSEAGTVTVATDQVCSCVLTVSGKVSESNGTAVSQVARESVIRDNNLNGISMQERRTLAADFTQFQASWSAGGSIILNGSGTFAERVLLSLSSISTTFGTAACRLLITGAGRTLFDKGIFGGEMLSDGVLTTPYFDVSMRAFTVGSVSASAVGTWVLKGTITLPEPFSSTEGRVLRDRQNRITIGVTSSVYTYTDDTLAFDAANEILYIAVSKSRITAAGYEDSISGATAYFWDTYGGLMLSQKSTETQTLPEYTLFFSEAGTVTVATDQVCSATVTATKKLVIDSGNQKAKANAVTIQDNQQAGAADQLRALSVELPEFSNDLGMVGSFASAVAYSATFNGPSIFRLSRLSLATNNRRMVLSITDSLGTVEKLTLLEGESISGATISSPYVDFIFEPRIINSVGINTTTGRTLMYIPVTLPGSLPSDTTRIIRDRKGVYEAYLPTTIAGGTSAGITYDASSGSLILAVLNSAVTAAGYELTTAGVIQYVVSEFTGKVFSQISSTTVTRVFCNLFKLAPGAVTVTTDGNAATDKVVTLTGSFYGPKMTTDELTTYRRYETTIRNNTGYATGLRPVRIKCRFGAGEVPNDRCLVVTDAAGVVYPCQWAGEPDFNPRRGRNLSYWGDDSLRSGELLILDNLAAGAAKKYVVKAYPTEQSASLYSRTVRESSTSFLVTADDGTQVSFDSVVGWLPYKLTRDSITYTNICQQLYATVTGTAWSYVAAGYTDYRYQVISDGPLFTEVETTFFNGAQTGNVALPV
ncbi:hypothetical protein ACJ5XQ_004965, partial [Klebsiella michiganensis]